MYLDLSHVSATSCKALHGHLFLSLREPFTDTTLESPHFFEKNSVARKDALFSDRRGKAKTDGLLSWFSPVAEKRTVEYHVCEGIRDLHSKAHAALQVV